MRHFHYLTRLLLVAAIAIALSPGQAEARRSASPAEARALFAGVRTYLATSGCCRVGSVRLEKAWLSTVNKDFGVAKIATTGVNGPRGPRATAVLVHTRSGRWTVIALGTAGLACGVAPKIRGDLRLQPCR